MAQRPLRAGRATKPARFYDEVRDRDGAAREENRQRQGADEAREFFFSFFFRRAILPASSSPSRESIRLTPPPLLPSDIHLSPTGGPPGSRHASRAGQIEGTEALLEESRAKNETRRERFNRRRQREREREARSAAASAREQSRRRGSWISSSSKPRPSSSSKPSLFSSKNTDRRPPPLRCGLRPRRLRDLHAGRADEGHRPALGRAGEFSISFFFFPPPACPLLFLLARFLSFFLPLFFLSPSPLLFFCFLFFQTFERA